MATTFDHDKLSAEHQQTENVAEKISTSSGSGELEAQTALHALGARLHAHFHDAFADRRVVPEVGQVVDGVSHAATRSPLRAGS